MALKLGVLTTLWNRPEIEAAVLGHLAALDVPGLALTLVCVASPEDPNPVDVPDGWTVVEHANEPLSDKHNAGAEAFADTDVEGVMVIGSDDLVSAEYLVAMAQHNRTKDPGVVSFDRLYMFDTAIGRMSVARPGRMGGGRVIHREVLEAVDWRPWPDGKAKFLDGASTQRLRGLRFPEHKVRAEDVPGGVLLDLKSRTNMWTYDDLATSTSAVEMNRAEIEAMFREHFPSALHFLRWVKDGEEPPKAEEPEAHGDGYPVAVRAFEYFRSTTRPDLGVVKPGQVVYVSEDDAERHCGYGHAYRIDTGASDG